MDKEAIFMSKQYLQSFQAILQDHADRLDRLQTGFFTLGFLGLLLSIYLVYLNTRIK